MRIGIFGGTFDPIHMGHLLIAEQSREQGHLDEVWFIPSARPPHKTKSGLTSFERRAEMLQLAIIGHEKYFRIVTIEKDRPGPSYTADTLSELQTLHPEHEFFLLVGADCLPDLSTWREPQRILRQAPLLASGRPGFTLWSAEQLAKSLHMPLEEVRLQRIEVPLVEISSRDLRQRIAADRSIRYQVPRAVEVYIREKKLYRD